MAEPAEDNRWPVAAAAAEVDSWRRLETEEEEDGGGCDPPICFCRLLRRRSSSLSQIKRNKKQTICFDLMRR